MVKLKRGQMTPIAFIIVMLIVIVLGVFVISYTADTSESIDRETISTTSNFTSTSLTNTLSPVEEGITSSSVKTYNQTWLDFDGVDLIALGTAQSLNVSDGNFTWGSWINHNGSGSSRQNIISRRASNIRYALQIYNNKSNCEISNGTVVVSIVSDDYLNDSQWHQIVCSRYSNDTNWNMTMYVDGVLQEDSKDTSSLGGINIASQTVIGRQSDGGSDYFTGNIDIPFMLKDDYNIYQSEMLNNERTRGKGVPILMFHQVGTYGGHIDIEDPEQFRSYISYLNSSGFETINTEQLYNWNLGTGTLPEKPIMLIFDDVSWTIYNISAPILADYDMFGVNANYPFGNIGDATHMSVQQATDLRDVYGWELVCHDVIDMLTGLDGSLNKENMTARFNFVRNNFTATFGSPCETWVYYGNNWNSTSNQIARELGFKVIFNNATSPPSRAQRYTYQDTNLTADESLWRIYIGNGTTIEEFIHTVDLYNNLSFKLDFNENNGTIAYDSSGNNNHGTITGATWNNDGILNTLTSGVDYTLNTATGLLTLSSDYLYTWLEVSWDYIYDNNTSDVSVLHLIELFIAIGIIAIFALYIKEKLE